MNLNLQASLWAQVKIGWKSLAEHFKLPTQDKFPLPLPADELNVEVFIEVEDATETEPPKFRVRLEADFEINPDGKSFLGFVLGRDCHFTFESSFAPSDELDSSQIAGTVGVEVPVKLPMFPDFDWLHLCTGDEAGWMTLRVSAKAQAGANAGFQLHAEIQDVFSADFQLPGITQPTPPLHLELTGFAGDINFTFADKNITGSLAATGNFRFNPSLAGLDVPMARYLEPLLRNISLEGTVQGILSLSPDKIAHCAAFELPSIDQNGPDMIIRASLLLAGNVSEFGISCEFKNSNHKIYLFDLLNQLTLNPEPILSDNTKHVGIEFTLSGVCICLGLKPWFAIQASAKAGIELNAYLMLSTTEVRIGLGKAIPGQDGSDIKLPLRIPHLSREQFGFIAKQPINDVWRQAANAQPPEKGRPLDRDIYESKNLSRDGKKKYNDGLELYFNVMEQITGAVPSQDRIALAYYETPGGWKVRPPADVTSNDDLPVRLITAFVAKKETDGKLTTTGELAVVCKVRGDNTWHVVLARPALKLEGFYFSLPFQNPRNIRVAGTARFTVEGPFEAIKELAVTVGLSADLIYFSIDADGKATIPIPEFIQGYGGGSFTLGKAMVGFGYTKRSLAIAFAGELVLPEKFVDDLDTSDVLGCGIRLPVKSKLAFQLDVIPFVIGQAVVPIPMFQFNCDLRQDSSPGLADPSTCTPNWDGLQVIVQDIIHCSLKRISYSPILVAYCSSNSDFGGDLVLGDSQNGLSIIANNIFWAYGMDSGAANMFYPVNGLPFFDNFCISIRVAGFRVNFNLQRPIPSFSPLAIFEILALLSDPLYEIEPRGELADMVRVSLTDAYIVLPDAARRLFPAAETMIHKPLNVTINIATFLTLVQRMVQALKPIATAVVEAIRHPEHVAMKLQETAAALRPGDIRKMAGEILSMLPPEMRKLRFEAKFAGFEANVVLLLTDRHSARQDLQYRGQTTDADNNTGWRYQPNIVPVPGAPRMYDPDNPQANVFMGSEFADFTVDDFDAIPPPLSDSLFDAEHIVPVLATKLKNDTRNISDYLRSRLSPQTRKLLGQYAGGNLSDALRSVLVNNLNNILKGVGQADPCLYEPKRFAGIQLCQLVQQWINRHREQKHPLSVPEIVRLNRMLLEAAYPDEMPETAGVLVGARVRLIGGQRTRFIGFVFQDGSFSFVSAINIPPLQLPVRGMTIPIPFAAEGRLTLSGRAKRDGVSGSLRAEGRAVWNAVPGLLYLKIGVDRMATLELQSNGKFAFNADAEVTLFNNPRCVLAKAEVQASETHCFVSGSLDLSLDLAANTRLLELHAKAEGEVGPNDHFRIAFTTETPPDNATGAGPGYICGIPMASIKGTLSDTGAEIEARLSQPEGDWSVIWPGGNDFRPPLRITDALLKGWINPRKTHHPSFGLDGAITLQLFNNDGPSITGRGTIASDEGRLRASVEGTLRWQGRDWLGGRVEIGSDGISIAGYTSLSIQITRDAIGSIKFAHLVFQINLKGEFTLNTSGGLTTYDIEGNWMLAGQNSSGQTFPLATTSLSISGGTDLNKQLVSIQPIKTVPFDLVVPIPNVSINNDPAWLKLIRRTVHWDDGDVFANEGYYIEFQTGWMGAKPDAYDFQHIHDDTLASLPSVNISEGSKNVTISDISENFSVSLKWKNGILGVEVGNCFMSF